MPQEVGPLKGFLQELHRRDVWRALAIFVGSGWGLLQVFDLFIERGFLPDWVFTGALVALIAGLPVVLGTAWVQGAGKEWERDDSGDGFDVARHLTWKKTVIGGVLAFAFLGLATTVYMAMRVTGIGAPGTLAAQGVFEEGGRIVLADFESSTPEAAPGDLVTEALRIDLAESPAFELVSNAVVTTQRGLMLMEPGTPLDETSAREVAVRDGAEAVVSGEVGRLGTGFVITARVLEAESGNALASFRVTADDESEIIDAIDELAGQLRAKIGESLRSVAASGSLPLQTTTSLEALKKVSFVRNQFTRGSMTGPMGQQIVQEAIELDSTFASAHQYLAILVNNYGGDRELGARSAEAAYRHRERLSERERLAVEGHYNRVVVGDDEEANRVFRRIAELDETDPVPWVNLADGLMYEARYDEAIEALMQVPMWEQGAYYFNRLVSHAGAGDLEAAIVAVDSAIVGQPNDPYHGATRAVLLSNFDLPERAREAVLDWPKPELYPLAFWHYPQAQADLIQGRLESARGHLEATLEVYEEFGTSGDVIQFGLARPWISVLYERDPDRAASELEALLSRVSWDELSSFNRNYPLVALTHGLIGDTTSVAELDARFQSEVGEFGNPYPTSRMALARGLAAVHREGEAGVPELEAGANMLRCVRCADLFLAYGYEVAGRTDDAIAAYDRFQASRFFTAPEIELHLFVPVAYERLGLLHEARGDTAEAAEWFARLSDLWVEPDPALSERAANARSRAEAAGVR